MGGLVLMLVVAVIAAVAIWMVVRDADRGSANGATSQCKELVEDRLKSPGTADFSEAETTSSGERTWTVRGSIDSQNGFGALVRSTYVCEIRYTSDGRWVLIDLQTNG